MTSDELSKRYWGDIAEKYDQRRMHAQKWAHEQECISQMLGALSSGNTVLDIPVGTGRFLEFYKEKGLRATGVDISKDMLSVAEEKALKLGLNINLRQGDISTIDADTNNFDAVISFRFLNWIDTPTLRMVVAELNRVAKTKIILGIRYLVPLSEIEVTTPRGFFRFVRQSGLRARRSIFGYMRGGRPRVFLHKKSDVLGIFRKLNLEIESSARIEAARNGTEYRIFLLEKK